MKGDSEILKILNEILEGELTAINQYFLHSRICADWGYKKLGDYLYHESIEEMKHAQTLIDRILFLEGLPNLQKLGALNIGETVPEQLQADLDLEFVAIPRLKKAIALCVQKSDFATREMLEKILVNEEEHVDWIESQQKMISDMGLENYLAEQMHKD